MGRAIAAGILRTGIVTADRLSVSDRTGATADALARDVGAHRAADNASAARAADVVVLCVKPKDVAGALGELRRQGALAHAPLVISIAAGVSLAAMERALGQGMERGRKSSRARTPATVVPVIRAMPNTPCLIGKGMTALAPSASVTPEQLGVAQRIFGSLGRCLVLDEGYFDAVTAVSASGPAFIYLVIEALADGGVRCGLPRHVSTEMVAQMTLGAAEMVLATERHPAALKDDVTTPGGCTIAGLLTLEDGKLRSVLARGVEVAAQVAGGLGR